MPSRCCHQVNTAARLGENLGKNYWKLIEIRAKFWCYFGGKINR
jgi:hypothetical protein